MNLDRINMRTLYVLGLAEKPLLPYELRRIVEGLRSGKSFDPIHIAVVIESLYAGYLNAVNDVSGKLNNTEDLPHRGCAALQSGFGSKDSDG